jgi:hypothetical protein
MIPIDLSVELLNPILGSTLANLWKEMMVGIPFVVPSSDKEGHHVAGDLISYTRGGPMGAYSSFATLAIVHHCLVQLASYRIDKKFTDAYRILGDDITISSRQVADSYLALTEEFGIPIKLIKSYPNQEGLVNFANQTFLKGTNISPASLVEEIAVKSVFGRYSMAQRLLMLGYGVDSSKSSLSDVLSQGAERVPSLLLLLSTLASRDEPSRYSNEKVVNWSRSMVDRLILILGPRAALALGGSVSRWITYMSAFLPSRKLSRGILPDIHTLPEFKPEGEKYLPFVATLVAFAQEAYPKAKSDSAAMLRKFDSQRKYVFDGLRFKPSFHGTLPSYLSQFILPKKKVSPGPEKPWAPYFERVEDALHPLFEANFVHLALYPGVRKDMPKYLDSFLR